ncbi:Uu.00g019120.m01.CDS01 [Anthostomella pinea]|uniref:Uu.00g019120.m01.CDS01 n=1 Tax=Anthostomella pinea TaxID=933095 RepID=A0AAI8VZ86_9PEZI|nr:Uu.00g019120.m01.CDS01 [Anthostomella pinea]
MWNVALFNLQPGQVHALVIAKSHSELHYPEAPSNEHHDATSYAAYAARTGLDIASKTYVGTHYEYTVAAALAPLGFTIKRIGGRSDHGIDLLGIWAVPSALPPNKTLRVLLQCKVSSKNTAIDPKNIRELEGAFVGAPVGWRGSAGVLGLLIAQKPATRGIRDALGRSRWPMGYVSCSADGRLEQMIWNRRAEEEGLDGMGVAAQLSEDAGRENQRLVLTWKGRPHVATLPPVDDSIKWPVEEVKPAPKKTRKPRKSKAAKELESADLKPEEGIPTLAAAPTKEDVKS